MSGRVACFDRKNVPEIKKFEKVNSKKNRICFFELTLEHLILQSGRIDRSEDSENREKKIFEKKVPWVIVSGLTRSTYTKKLTIS